ncbi:MAG TPA: TPM domain-containing protein, partial [Gemmatimonadales bacterium]|nr:TPM domain-containing protein [Gemmatimonadales bacterium]
MLAFLLALAIQTQFPAPTGYVNDFAGIIPPAQRAQMEAIAREVKEKCGGEIAIVTLDSLNGESPIEAGVDIGRQWGVGAKGAVGDSARNAGVVLLLVPGKHPGDGKAQIAIATGFGVEGFLTDARSGEIRDAIGRTAVDQGSYAAGLLAGTWLIGQAYAREFHFTLTGNAPPLSQPTGSSVPPAVIPILFFVFFFVIFPTLAALSRRGRYGHRGSGLGWLLLGMFLGGGGRGGGWGGG